ncbi:MAG: 3-deoxy-manno-octulosonate cytidylyltransferase, partial [Desulfatitalea sp.]|nr:3-deoxy-manno-octulosonate cytidylyltransferase [Desulfatitalea sp.]NNK01963.1 3-deoxy-manno-octulosonate cytidylyltransferase [Desulfatitalea sp.]
VVVATDDQRIHSAVSCFNGNAMMTDAEHRSGTDRVAEVAEKLALAPADLVINVQGDQPLVRPDCFDAVVAPLLADPGLDMSTLAFTIHDVKEYTNPKDCKVVMDGQSNALYFSRAPIPWERDQDQSFVAYKHLGVYAYRRPYLDVFRRLPTGRLEQIEKLEQLRALENGHRIRVVVTPYDSPEVDLPEDIGRIERLWMSPTA